MFKKILAEVPRVLFGAVLVLSGVAGLLHAIPPPPEPLTGAASLYMTGLTGTYLFTLVKLTEVLAGVLLLSNRLVPLALVVFAPVLVNIVGFHLFYAPSGLPVPVLLLAAELSLAWKHRAAFGPMLKVKSGPVSV